MSETTTETEELRPIPQHDERGIPLLRIIWEQILADQRAWNQGTWIGVPSTSSRWDRLRPDVIAFILEHHAPPWNCGTAYCLAGHGALATGARLHPDAVKYVYELGSLSASTVLTPGGGWEEVSDYAASVFELNDDQASVLFAASNTAWRIEFYIRALETDPDADLYDFDEYVLDIQNERVAWEIEHGFLTE